MCKNDKNYQEKLLQRHVLSSVKNHFYKKGKERKIVIYTIIQGSLN